jgi:hypothetical protein
MSTSTGDQGDPARTALAELLGSTEIDIAAEVSSRLPTGEEVRLVYGAVRGDPNRSASVVIDSGGAVQPPHRYEALYGRDVFAPAVSVPARPAGAPPQPVTIDPPVNDLTLPECVTEDETVTVKVPPGQPQADVYLLVDNTGSMNVLLPGLQSTLNAVIQAFPGVNVAWGVGNYKDLPIESSPYPFQNQQSLTTDLAAVSAAIGAWTANVDGDDIAEGQLFALQQIATDLSIGWRAGSKRIIMWFGDAPGNDPICAAVSPTGADITEATAITALQENSITVVAVNTPSPFGNPAALNADPVPLSNGYGGQCTPAGHPGQADRISGMTGGSEPAGSDAATLIGALQPLIAAAVPPIGHLVLQPTGAIASFVSSISPASYDSLDGTVAHTLPFQVGWRGTADCADTDQVFTGSLDVVADGTVAAVKPVTITVPACRWHHSVEMICGLQRSGEGHQPCQTVVDGRYATAVTIYNPTTCPVTVEKFFAPLVLRGEPLGREPRTIPARPFARIILEPGTATLDDCCTLGKAIGPAGGPLLVGVLDIVADHALEVTATHTANGAGEAATSITSRTITPRRA